MARLVELFFLIVLLFAVSTLAAPTDDLANLATQVKEGQAPIQIPEAAVTLNATKPKHRHHHKHHKNKGQPSSPLALNPAAASVSFQGHTKDLPKVESSGESFHVQTKREALGDSSGELSKGDSTKIAGAAKVQTFQPIKVDEPVKAELKPSFQPNVIAEPVKVESKPNIELVKVDVPEPIKVETKPEVPEGSSSGISGSVNSFASPDQLPVQQGTSGLPKELEIFQKLLEFQTMGLQAEIKKLAAGGGDPKSVASALMAMLLQPKKCSFVLSQNTVVN